MTIEQKLFGDGKKNVSVFIVEKMRDRAFGGEQGRDESVVVNVKHAALRFEDGR